MKVFHVAPPLDGVLIRWYTPERTWEQLPAIKLDAGTRIDILVPDNIVQLACIVEVEDGRHFPLSLSPCEKCSKREPGKVIPFPVRP